MSKNRKLLQKQLNFFDLDTAYATGFAYTATHLAPIPQGAGDSTRKQDSVTFCRLKVRLYGLLHSAVQDMDKLRVVVFFDHQNNNAGAPTQAEIFQNVSTCSDYRWDQMNRFQILYDKSQGLSILLAGGTTAFTDEFTLDLGDTRCLYSNTTGTNVVSGALYMVATTALVSTSLEVYTRVLYYP